MILLSLRQTPTTVHHNACSGKTQIYGITKPKRKLWHKAKITHFSDDQRGHSTFFAGSKANGPTEKTANGGGGWPAGGFSNLRIAPVDPKWRAVGMLQVEEGDETRNTLHLWAPYVVTFFGAWMKK